ncbi:hypothetical protein K435DRAFT_579882, partial [Dendrothele bispora CBS 962.96]
WTDAVGIATLNSVASKRVPQWLNGLYEYQVEPISCLLNQEHVLLFVGTGSGKAALFIIPLI